MTKVHKSFRLDAEAVAELEAFAKEAGISNAEALQRLIQAGVERIGQKAAEGDTEGAQDTTEALRGIVDVLRESNTDLRATVSTLTAQLAVKDEQITRAHELAYNAQALHLQDAQRALPEHRPSLWDRLRGRGRGERDDG